MRRPPISLSVSRLPRALRTPTERRLPASTRFPRWGCEAPRSARCPLQQPRRRKQPISAAIPGSYPPIGGQTTRKGRSLTVSHGQNPPAEGPAPARGDWLLWIPRVAFGEVARASAFLCLIGARRGEALVRRGPAPRPGPSRGPGARGRCAGWTRPSGLTDSLFHTTSVRIPNFVLGSFVPFLVKAAFSKSFISR